jgi:hypothetical protein
MFGISKMRELQQMAQNPHESEMAHAFASIVANLEHDLLDAVEDLHDALDVDDPVRVEGSRDERVERLLDLAEAAGNGDLEGYWFSEVADLDNPEEAVDFVGLTGEEWTGQIEAWGEMYREKAPEQFEGWTDREIAAWHVDGEHGVPLGEFEREVVGYSRRSALKGALAGNFSVGIQGVHRAAEAVKSSEQATESEE